MGLTQGEERDAHALESWLSAECSSHGDSLLVIPLLLSFARAVYCALLWGEFPV